MKIDEYITGLRNNNNIIVTVLNDKLRIKASQKDLTNEILEDIKAKKNEILTFFETIDKKKTEIEPVAKQEHYNLSHAQRRLWVLDQLVDTQGLYNVPIIYSFESLDVNSFNQALFGLILRHEILRTTIHMIGGEPRQVVHSVQEFDFSVFRHKVNSTELDDIIKRESFYPLELTNSAIRATLIEKTNGSLVFIFVLHHIITDGWSMDVLLSDFLALYDHYSTGSHLNLPDLQIQYKDYSHWQHEQITSGKLDNSRNYWLKKLSGEIHGLKLPLDNKRKELKSYEGAGVAFEMAPEHVERLTVLGKENGATLFMVLVGVVKTLLFRYTDQEDIMIGTPVTGRDHPELENQVGFYSNTIVLRSTVKGSDSFSQLLLKLYKVILEGYEHQYYPFDLLVDELNLERDMNRNPLFDVMISFYDDLDNNEVTQKWESTEEIITIAGGVNKFDLTYTFNRMDNGGLYVNINYNTSLFKKEKTVRMASHLKNLILGILDDPESKISDIEYLSKEEVHQIVDVFNHTYENYNLDTSIKELIEVQAKKSPKEISLISEENSMTFEEMNARANQLAHYLSKKHNVEQGNYVGVAMNSTIERMIALLSIIKLGATYVPLDPEYPTQRMSYIIDDTRLNVLITDHSSNQSIDNKLGNYFVIFIEEVLPKLIGLSCENPDVKVDPDDIFAVFYTSGSTGEPKGVLLKNNGLINTFQWCWNNWAFGKNDIIYQKTNFVFDVSLAELFMPLCFGAGVLMTEGDSSQELVDNIFTFKVTHIGFSPTMLNRFLEISEDETDKISSLKYVVAAGEELLKETVSRYYSKFKIPLINQYGPTEASIYVTAYDVKPDDHVIPIGKPISNVKLYILDGNNKLLPVGVPGEIGIGGVGLAEGYLNEPEKTIEKFIQDPYCNKGGQRIYKTGDIGSWNEDGEIVFLGRQDNQLSIWGSRIESGEVESMTLEHPEVKEVAVVVNKDSYGNPHLIAYYVKKERQIENLHDENSHPRADLQSNVDRQNIFNENTNRVKDYPINFRIHELFEKSAKENAHSIAVVCEGREISYKSLNDSADQLALSIKSSHQIGRGDLVGILMERCEKMIVSILAILKMGAAYVPIDPDYPDARIKYILKDSSIGLVILDEENEQKSICHSVQRIIYDDIKQEINEHQSLQDIRDGSISDLCYVCYTSGSTGRPKGVMIEHHSVVDYVLTFIEYFELDKRDTVIQQSSISFDTAVEEIFPILCAGGKLIVLPEGGRNIDGIIHAINENQATVLSTTPLVINEVNLRFNELIHHPRVLISGGDELRPSYIDKIVNPIKLYNTYGPTETTVCASFALIDSETKSNVIGAPIANHKIYVLNDDMESLAAGKIGEICISGSGLARGYINRKEETDRYFVSNPFDEGLLYKTGDLARYNEDGLIEFCGRKDNQVKIRGYRVEPSEVDQIVKLYEKIINCFTTSKSDSDENKHLITYYTSLDTLDNEELRSFLNEQLPHYMVPDYFIQINEFPRTINGKINTDELSVPYMLTFDRALNIELKDFLKSKLPIYMVPSHFRNLDKLPLTATGKVDRKTLEGKSLLYDEKELHLTPKNEIEKKILEIWENCLNQSGIGTDNNFFEVGGNSIKATQIVSEIYRDLKCNVSLKDIFNNPTIIELSRLIIHQAASDDLTIKLNKIDPNLPNVFFIPPIIGSSTIFRDLAMKLNSLFNVYGLQYKGFDDEDSFDSSIEEMAETFVQEIKKIKMDKSVSLVGYSMGVPIAFEIAKILEKEDCDVSLIFIDRGVNDYYEQGVPANKQEVYDIIEKELKYWIQEGKEQDMERIKRLIYNNIQILNSYRTNGKIQGKITTIEATNNLHNANMSEWSSCTHGNIEHHYVDSDHYGILDKENISPLAKFITTAFSEHMD